MRVQMPSLCAMEINEIRPFFVHAMGVLVQLAAEQPTGTREEEYD
jgi:GINS complex subunit 2